jgi:hypothetical protein
MNMLETDGMDSLCNGLVSAAYVSQGCQQLRACSHMVKDLLSRRKLPERGWPEHMLERLMSVRFQGLSSTRPGRWS